jgi:photosystem II stability/assembly factor-like uncharacterized protein
MKKIFLVILLIFISNSNLLLSNALWEKVNGPLFSNIYNFCVNNQGEIFVYTYHNYGLYNGLYKSIDTGKTCNHLNINFPIPYTNTPLSDFIIDKNNRIIFSNGCSICYTEDNGLDWKYLGLNLDSNELVGYKQIFKANDTIFIVIERLGLYRLSEDWSRWEKIFTIDNIINKTYSFVSTKNNTYFFTNDKGLFKSTDFGNTWDTVNAIQVQMIYCDSDGILYLRNQKNINKSTDDGQSWTPINQPNNSYDPSHEFSIDEEGNIFSIGIFPITVFQSKDKGNNWKLIYTDTLCDDARIHLKHYNGIFYICDFKSLVVSTNNGNSWDRIFFNIFKSPISSVIPLDINRLLVSNDHGLFLSDDLGKNYNLLFPQCTTGNVFSKLSKKKDIIYGTGIFTFIYSFDNLVHYVHNRNFYADFDISQDSTFYASVQSFIKSKDFGKTWDTINGNLPNYGGTGRPYVTSFCINEKKEILAAIYEGGIYKSKDIGQSWDLKFKNYLYVQQFLSNDNIIYGISNSIKSNEQVNNNIYKSTDSGESWNLLIHDLPNAYYKYILANNGDIFAFSPEYGNGIDKVFLSTDGGNSWKISDINFNPEIVTAMTVADDGTLWCGTDSGSIYHSKIPYVLVKEKKYLTNNISISPNPANEYVDLLAILSEVSDVNIEIYNVFGQLLQKDKRCFFDYGSHNIRLDIKDLEPGFYYIRFSTKDIVESFPLVIIR